MRSHHDDEDGRPRESRPSGLPDVPAALHLAGVVLRYLTLAFAVPLAVALWQGENPWPFVAGATASFVLGVALSTGTAPVSEMRPRDTFLALGLGWLLAAVAVSVPYLMSGLSIADAVFEAMSGLTTTGASVLASDVEQLDRSLLLWRQLSQWIGGLGFVALSFIVLPRLRVAGRELFEQETGGPTELDRPRRSPQSIGTRLAALYVALTVVVAVVLATLGWTGLDEEMTPFEAVAHALTTVSTGGFSTQAESIGAFAPITQWILVAAILVAATNFAVVYVTVLRRPLLEGRRRPMWRDDELRFLVAVLAGAALVVFVQLVQAGLPAGESTARQAVFTTVSIGTATGYTNADYSDWPALSVLIVLALMLLGGSAMTACGSIKPLRHVLFLRVLQRELQRIVMHDAPPVKFNGRTVDEPVLRGALSFAFAYMLVLGAGALCISALEAPQTAALGALEALGTAAATLGTVGPGLGVTGPGGAGYGSFGDPAKLVMVVLMWLGRLEILTIAVLLTSTYWRPPREP